jgi:hypothetical protein
VGDPIRIYHSEAAGYLSASCNPHKKKRPFLSQGEHSDPTHPSNNSAKHLFYMETPSRKTGGVVRWYAKYRFRHVISGKYLSVKPRVSDELTYGEMERDVSKVES